MTSGISRRELVHRTVRMGLALGVLGAMAGCQTRPRHRASTVDRDDLWKGGDLAGGGRAGSNRSAPAGPSAGAGYFDLPDGVIPRAQWTSAGVIVSRANPMVRVERITVHHDAIDSSSIRTRSDAVRRLESVRSGHVGREWADIGYHFVIDPMGNVWEGRPLRYQGAHVSDQNERNMGVMVMGNFMEQSPTSAARSALDGFLRRQMERYNLSVSRVYTHRELGPTLCPGTMLQSHMAGARGSRGVLARE